MPGKIEGAGAEGMTEDKMAGWHPCITNSMDMSLSKLRLKDRDAWSAAVHGVAKSWHN